MMPVRLANHGTLYNYTVVHRSYPGVPVPFVSAIVDLADGGSLRGTLLGVDPDPTALEAGMPVEVVFRDTGQISKEGQSFLAYYFVPRTGAAS